MNTTIIIIDDNLDNIKLASMILKKEGYTVLSALSVIDGIKAMKEHKISLILLDIMMPDIDGINGLKLIKKEKDFRDIPIIMLTAISTKDYVLKALNAGADDYLAKPYKLQTLVEKTKRFIESGAGNDNGREIEEENVIVLDDIS